MLDGDCLRDRARDFLAGVGDSTHRRAMKIEADRIGRQEGIESAAIGDVDAHRSPGRCRRDAIERIDERRHAVEAHMAVAAYSGDHQAAGTLEAHHRLG